MTLLLPLVVALACLFAGLAQLLAFASPTTSDLRILNVARRITGVFMLVAAFYIAHLLWKHADVDRMLCLIVGGLALGQLLFAMHTFYEPSETERLMSRTCPPRSTSGTHA